MKRVLFSLAYFIWGISAGAFGEVAETSLFRGYGTSTQVILPTLEPVSSPVLESSPVVTPVVVPVVTPPVVQSAVPALDDKTHEEWSRRSASDALIPACGLPVKLDYLLNCFVDGIRDDGLVLVAKNSIGECGIDKVDLLFDYFGTLDIARGRSLIISLVRGLITAINKNEKLACFFNVFPITEMEVDIRIRIRPPHCGFLYPPLGNISYIIASDGDISYQTLNSFTYEMDNLRTERFKTAEQIVTGVRR